MAKRLLIMKRIILIPTAFRTRLFPWALMENGNEIGLLSCSNISGEAYLA